MIKKLSNSSFAAEIQTSGAELISFKKLDDNCEYIWNGDPKFWGSHSPVLFPIVCALINGEIKINENTYQIGNHGFAKKSEFELIEESERKAVFKLSYNEATLAMYPFKFNLYLIYTLNENQLTVEYQVENIDEQTIYFQIGTHPGFNCPLDDNTDFDDYYLEFKNPENLARHYMNSANVIIADKTKNLELKDNRILPLNHEGAIVLKNLKSDQVILKSDKTAKKVVLTYENLPHMGIWQAKNAPFICLEPWRGCADTEGFKGDIKEKEAIIALEKAAKFNCSWMIEIF